MPQRLTIHAVLCVGAKWPARALLPDALADKRLYLKVKCSRTNWRKFRPQVRFLDLEGNELVIWFTFEKPKPGSPAWAGGLGCATLTIVNVCTLSVIAFEDSKEKGNSSFCLTFDDEKTLKLTLDNGIGYLFRPERDTLRDA